MNTFKWLVKRELWEHRGAFVWAPIVVAIAVVVLISVTSLVAMSSVETSLTIDGVKKARLADWLSNNPDGVGRALSLGYFSLAMPAFYTATFCIFFFCLSALYDDRRDRSIFFWKSLPISDTQTVLSKVTIALFIAPLIAFSVGMIAAALLTIMALVAAAIYGVNLVGIFLTMPSTYLSPIQFIALWPIYVLWALPTIGWLFIVSAWARSKPFLWAVGLPLIAGLLITWTGRLLQLDWDTQYLWKDLIGRLLLSIVPGGWMDKANMQDVTMEAINSHSSVMIIFDRSWQLLLSPNIWIGAVLGVAMLAGAIWLRSHRDEI
jgi:ABC-2 type transport system permease protein